MGNTPNGGSSGHDADDGSVAQPPDPILNAAKELFTTLCDKATVGFPWTTPLAPTLAANISAKWSPGGDLTPTAFVDVVRRLVAAVEPGAFVELATLFGGDDGLTATPDDLLELIVACASLATGIDNRALFSTAARPVVRSCFANRAQMPIQAVAKWMATAMPSLGFGLRRWVWQVLAVPPPTGPVIPVLTPGKTICDTTRCFACVSWISFGFSCQYRDAVLRADQFLVTPQWRRLYNSTTEGQSANRFEHHCFRYHGPTVILLDTAVGLHAVAVEDELDSSEAALGTRGGTRVIAFGSPDETKDFHFGVLSPARGPLQVYCNLRRSRQAALGVGVGRVGCAVDRYAFWVCADLLSGTSSVGLPLGLDAVPFQVYAVEVYGCGGDEALAAQSAAHQRQKAQAARANKVDKSAVLADLDRELLTMAGTRAGANIEIAAVYRERAHDLDDRERSASAK